ncbi:terminase [Plantactinospora sp. B6F1]|uniref:terminase n=1 Tax=Plantactinospora sp. B6F1 TaxID=3158971 RepID=UPI0032D9412F
MDFARDVLAHPYDPWQRWTVIHAGELLPDGRERFKYRLVLVARQNGKSEIVVVLVPYWMFVERVAQILATSTKLPMAKKLWLKSRKLIEAAGLDELLGRRWYREANGEIEIFAPARTAAGEPWGSSYAIDASNEEGGRSLSVNRLALDELRHHYDYSAWGASVRTMGSIEDAQAWLLSNAGSDRSVVLNDLRDAIVEEMPDGTEVVPHDPDTDIFLAEWSTPRDADPLDVHALGQANPNMNRRGQKAKDLLADARRAVKTGGEALTEFKTEVMCIRVKVLNPAIDPGQWIRCLDPGTLDDARSRIALCFDLAPDGLHATLAAAAMLPDDRVRIEVVEAWSGPTCVDDLRRELPHVIARVRPQVLGWLPNGPSAALAADMAERNEGGRRWPPPGVKVEAIKAEVPAVCMGFEEQVRSAKIAQSDDPLLNAQVAGAELLKRGGVWVFSRSGESHVDALYASAGAVHLARTLPPPVGGLRIVVAPDDED